MQSLFTILDVSGVQFYNDSIYQTKTLSLTMVYIIFLPKKVANCALVPTYLLSQIS